MLRHPVIDRHYFAEYANAIRQNQLKYNIALAYDRYVLSNEERDDLLKNYLDGLIQFAISTGKRPVLCFCRSQMRFGWMKSNYGGIHVGQIRNPIDQWVSFKSQAYFPNRMIYLSQMLFRQYPTAFEHLEFIQKLKELQANGGDRGNRKNDLRLTESDGIGIFLIIWLASSLQTLSYADRIIDIDLLSESTAYQQDTSQWFLSNHVKVNFSDCASPNRNHAEDFKQFFKSHFEKALSAMQSNSMSLFNCVPEKIEKNLSYLSGQSRWFLEEYPT